MRNDVVILTACDERYFSLCVDLISSINDACGGIPRIRVLDVGMRPQQVAELRRTVEAVIEPGWDVGDGATLPQWYRAMTARPFLPKYAADAAVIVWIDSDAWVQKWEPLDTLINAAADGRMAIVEESFGEGWVADVLVAGRFERHSFGPDTSKYNVRTCYEKCFGHDIAAAFGELPQFNSGVFALRVDSPSWAIWQNQCAEALSKSFHFLAEQQALNVGIRQGRIPVVPQALEANFVCSHELPWFSMERRIFTIPREANGVLGVIHLTDAKAYPLILVPVFPSGTPRRVPLIYREFKSFLEKQPNLAIPGNPELAGKISRNSLCPCGSGKRYKHCHGHWA